MNVLVFEHKTICGWVLYGKYDDVRVAFNEIKNAPNQDTQYRVYINSKMPTKLYPSLCHNKFEVFEFIKTVYGKSCDVGGGYPIQYCIKTEGMPYLFTEQLFEE